MYIGSHSFTPFTRAHKKTWSKAFNNIIIINLYIYIYMYGWMKIQIGN